MNDFGYARRMAHAETARKARLAWCESQKAAGAARTAPAAKPKGLAIALTTGEHAAGPAGYLQRQPEQSAESEGPQSFNELASKIYAK